MVRGGGQPPVYENPPIYEVVWWRGGSRHTRVATALWQAVEPIIGRTVMVETVCRYPNAYEYADDWAGDMSDVQALAKAKNYAHEVSADEETYELLASAYEKVYLAEAEDTD